MPENAKAAKEWDKFKVGDEVITLGTYNYGISGWCPGIKGKIERIGERKIATQESRGIVCEMLIKWEKTIDYSNYYYMFSQLELVNPKATSSPKKDFYISHGVSVWDLVDKTPNTE